MPATAITLADIQSADWSLALDSPGMPGSGIGNVVQGLADVNQCLQIILTTPKGSDPLRPTFGADIWQYIDYPIDAAIPSIVREVTEAITLWEPRVQLIAVRATPVADSGAQSDAHLNVVITWRLKLSSSGAATPLASTQTTSVTAPAALSG
jgi:Bacteriophage baseplate protein W